VGREPTRDYSLTLLLSELQKPKPVRSEIHGFVVFPGYRWQLTAWPGSTVTGTGLTSRQTSMAFGQRGWKRHPAGGVMRLGIVPGMPSSACSRRTFHAARRMGTTFGN
jgi:hypothetical protein